MVHPLSALAYFIGDLNVFAFFNKREFYNVRSPFRRYFYSLLNVPCVMKMREKVKKKVIKMGSRGNKKNIQISMERRT